jgi:hypothetical protein
VRGGNGQKNGVIDWAGLASGLMLVCSDADGLERRCWRALRGRDMAREAWGWRHGTAGVCSQAGQEIDIWYDMACCLNVTIVLPDFQTLKLSDVDRSLMWAV